MGDRTYHQLVVEVFTSICCAFTANVRICPSVRCGQYKYLLCKRQIEQLCLYPELLEVYQTQNSGQLLRASENINQENKDKIPTSEYFLVDSK